MQDKQFSLYVIRIYEENNTNKTDSSTLELCSEHTLFIITLVYFLIILFTESKYSMNYIVSVYMS